LELCFGSCDARSLVACALRAAAGIPANAGAVKITRGACAPHSGQFCASPLALIGRIAVKLPQCAQSYS
jgi:hypothetical protein